MLTSIIAAIALAIGLAAPHAHGAAPAQTAHAPVTAFDASGGGPPGSPFPGP